MEMLAHYEVDLKGKNVTLVGRSIDKSGNAWSYGINNKGQLGLSQSVNSQIAPMQIDIAHVTGIAAGAEHVIFVKSNGEVYAAGNADHGRLGISGASGYVYRPTVLDGRVAIVEAAAGGMHSAILNYGADLFTFGSNSYGQLGRGGSSAPAKVDAKSVTYDIAAGESHTLASDSENNVYGWGRNLYGELGLGNYDAKSQPTRIDYFHRSGKKIDTFSAGNGYTLVSDRDGNISATSVVRSALVSPTGVAPHADFSL